jgi:ParB family chromosome partitioning protein
MRKALGRGIDALIPGANRGAAPESAPPDAPSPDLSVAIDKIRPNPRQPRTEFDEAALSELAGSIKVQGIIQPLLVRPMDDGDFELVAGERRLRAAERAGLTHVPVFVREMSDRESLELALVENIQRDDLSPLEEATAYQRLINEFHHTQEEVAARVGKSRPAIANALRLLKLPDTIKRDLSRGRLTAGHARVLLSIDDPAAQADSDARDVGARRRATRRRPQECGEAGIPRPESCCVGTPAVDWARHARAHHTEGTRGSHRDRVLLARRARRARRSTRKSRHRFLTCPEGRC